jgi:23S rRNA U2552 (ribose-2'-O)-methylase RlmE/FtsJ
MYKAAIITLETKLTHLRKVGLFITSKYKTETKESYSKRFKEMCEHRHAIDMLKSLDKENI